MGLWGDEGLAAGWFAGTKPVPGMRVQCQQLGRLCDAPPVRTRDEIHFCAKHDPGPDWKRPRPAAQLDLL